MTRQREKKFFLFFQYLLIFLSSPPLFTTIFMTHSMLSEMQYIMLQKQVNTDRILKAIGLSVFNILTSPFIQSKQRNRRKTFLADEILSLTLQYIFISSSYSCLFHKKVTFFIGVDHMLNVGVLSAHAEKLKQILEQCDCFVLAFTIRQENRKICRKISCFDHQMLDWLTCPYRFIPQI